MASRAPQENIWFFRNIPAKQRLTVGGKRPDDDAYQETMYPITMEEAESGYGYMLYSVNLKNYHHENKLKVVGYQ